MTPDPDEYSKAIDGGCRWSCVDAFEDEFDALAEEDVVVYEFLETVMEYAEQDGIDADQLKAPEGVSSYFRSRHNRPWLGALFADGKPDKRDRCLQYRLYFGEAPEDQPSLVASKLGSKPKPSPRRIWETMQNSHIKQAMDRLQAWCKKCDCSYRKLRGR
ncbi:hypothetical protein IU447_24045 [Nocardia farcinica]|uniref:hypothetical protein n=1 Tax=Nocardia farcinica TaxID=37329 RepID=UPI0018943A46|nr:hypothetical protein [Nocardia farcinica]MBF6363192.1 hypothetical protein [Nocardia farcinica]